MNDGDHAVDGRRRVGDGPVPRGCIQPYDPSEPEPISRAIAEAIELLAGPDHERLGPLNDSVDVEALDDLFAPTGRGERRRGWVTFDHGGYAVTIDSTGFVAVRAPSKE